MNIETTKTMREHEATYSIEDRKQVTRSSDVNTFLQTLWEDIDDVESFHVLALSMGNQIIAHKVVSYGGISGCVCDPKIIFRYALQVKGCCQIVIAHNHPSGNVKPSQADIVLTKKMVDGGKFLDLKVCDHMIMTPIPGRYYSFADEGML